jgi:hypothetical protein
MAYANYEQAARYLVGLTSAMRGYMSTLYGDFSKEKEEIRQLKKQEIHRPILADSLKTKVEYLKKGFFESNFSNFYSTVFGKEEKVSLLHYVYAKEELFKRLKKFVIADELGKNIEDVEQHLTPYCTVWLEFSPEYHDRRDFFATGIVEDPIPNQIDIGAFLERVIPHYP